MKSLSIANRLVCIKFKGKNVKINKVAQTVTLLSLGIVYEYQYSARKQKVIYRIKTFDRVKVEEKLLSMEKIAAKAKPKIPFEKQEPKIKWAIIKGNKLKSLLLLT